MLLEFSSVAPNQKSDLLMVEEFAGFGIEFIFPNCIQLRLS